MSVNIIKVSVVETILIDFCHFFYITSTCSPRCNLQSVEIHKRVGAFSVALETVNKCLSDVICAMSRGRLDGESRAASLIQSGNDILENFKYSSGVRLPSIMKPSISVI